TTSFPGHRTDDLLKQFKLLDTNGDGELSEDEILNGLRRSGYNLSREEIQKHISNFDTNGDGQINFEEFTAFFNSKS
ncbi:uncharacterized protein LOC143277260, partial [Babylonia areolata]|uniref:uncharacterized protein LOC143277260 n=1 Tax=Babylonia areolata TaxID=304850 RepID=UPI003FCFEFBD